MKLSVLFTCLWLLTLFAGSIVSQSVPQEYVYSAGFITGCTSIIFLQHRTDSVKKEREER